MKPFAAFAAKGQWYRGNCHTHTTLSDGKDSAGDTARAYREAGYDFLVLTDHRKSQSDVDDLQRKGFLVINGVELHPPSVAPAVGAHHIVAIGVDSHPRASAVLKGSARSVIRWIRRHGGMALYAHPYWTGHDLRHMEEGRSAFGVEVYNSVCETVRGLGDSSAHLDQALSNGFRWKVFGVDDAHSVERDAFGGWIMVKSTALTQRAVLTAIRKGRFYASSGPTIRSLALRRGVARIECSPVRRIVWHCRGSLGSAIHAGRKLLTEDEYDVRRLRSPQDYLRVEITDSKGRKAWSNPIFRDRKTGRWTD